MSGGTLSGSAPCSAPKVSAVASTAPSRPSGLTSAGSATPRNSPSSKSGAPSSAKPITKAPDGVPHCSRSRPTICCSSGAPTQRSRASVHSALAAMNGGRQAIAIAIQRGAGRRRPRGPGPTL